MIDLKDNSEAVSVDNLDLEEGFVDEITYIHYQFNGYSTNSDGCIYIDDLKVTHVTAISEARKVVVKAERTKAYSDIIAAKSSVELYN